MAEYWVKESPTYVLTRLDEWNHNKKLKFYSKEFCQYLNSEKERKLEEITSNYFDQEAILLIHDHHSGESDISPNDYQEIKKSFSKGFYSVISMLNNEVEVTDGWFLKDLVGDDIYKTQFETLKEKIRKLPEFISKIESIVKDDPCIILKDEDIDKIFLETFENIEEYIKITNYTLDFAVIFYSALPKSESDLLMPLKKSIEITKHLNTLITRKTFADLAK